MERLNTILIDDEALALDYLEHQLLQVSDVRIMGRFTDPLEGMKGVLQADPDVVFLDIHLPEVNGIELAERMLESKPGLRIVFVTAYDHFAIKAFELNALDYVMKPVTAQRLRNTLQRIQASREDDRASASGPVEGLRLRLFGQVMIQAGGDTPRPIRWRTAKAQEVFLYLLQNRDKVVRKSLLIDMLWPTAEESKAYAQLYTAVYQIRKTLAAYGSSLQLTNAAGGYLLELRDVLLDVEQWEKATESERDVDERSIGEYEEAMALFDGEYLEGLDYIWALGERERLNRIWYRTGKAMAEWYALAGLTEKAIDMYDRIVRRYPQIEEAHFALMRLYAAVQDRPAVHRQYRILADTLKEEANEAPGEETTSWYREWNGER